VKYLTKPPYKSQVLVYDENGGSVSVHSAKLLAATDNRSLSTRTPAVRNS